MALPPLTQTGHVTTEITATWIDIQIRATGRVDFHAQATLLKVSTLARQPVMGGQQVGGKAVERLGRHGPGLSDVDEIVAAGTHVLEVHRLARKRQTDAELFDLDFLTIEFQGQWRAFTV